MQDAHSGVPPPICTGVLCDYGKEVVSLIMSTLQETCSVFLIPLCSLLFVLKWG